ncbi:type III secretion protein HrpB2 [Paraburkholderia phosphatilytica]|uniref:type III secretion protein HrpB2 n=1 Tax=Paraburkholderia phosphatilytica TaxID=2282883 RepID=UPI000E54281A|nr:type III secretion protein HrpB2 [Paraburkholderia phosphatilytica]
MAIDVNAAQMQAALEKLAEGNNAPTQTPAELADRFQSLMQTAKLESPAPTTPGEGMETASQLLKEQDAQLERVSTDAQAFESSAPQMSMEEVSAAGMQLMMEMSTAQINLQAKMGVVESSKTSIETLMRNQ